MEAFLARGHPAVFFPLGERLAKRKRRAKASTGFAGFCGRDAVNLPQILQI
jgi:hypothetical protein